MFDGQLVLNSHDILTYYLSFSWNRWSPMSMVSETSVPVEDSDNNLLPLEAVAKEIANFLPSV